MTPTAANSTAPTTPTAAAPSEEAAPAPGTDPGPPSPGSGASQGVAAVETTLPPAEALDHIQQLARRGKIPGFEARQGGFVATAYGEPFDSTIVGAARPAAAGARIDLALQLRWKAPLLVGVIIAVTIWPGVWLTDSMLRTYFPSYDFPTWIWYLPITIVPLPWSLRRMVRKSRDASLASLAELRTLLEGSLPKAG